MSEHRLFDGMTIDGHEVDYSQLEETGMVIVNGEEWDASDLITPEDERDVFNEDMLRTKDDILRDIDFRLSRINEKKKKDKKHSQAYYTRLFDLIEKFRSRVEESVFPDQLEDWWQYEYDIEETGIKLVLSHADYVSLNSEGYIDTVSVDTEFDLFTVKAGMLTVEQYAQANEVTTTAVRQWIRRGKIRTAVKQGSEWSIPALAEVRDRGYQFAQYHWDEYLTGFPEEYGFINDYRLVTISQNEENKDMFDLHFIIKDENVKDKNIQMDKKEKEKFELLLISNPFVKPVGVFIG